MEKHESIPLTSEDFDEWERNTSIPEHHAVLETYHAPPWDEVIKHNRQHVSAELVSQDTDAFSMNATRSSVPELIAQYNEPSCNNYDQLQIPENPEAKARFNVVLGNEYKDEPRNKGAFTYYQTQALLAQHHLRRIGCDIYKYEDVEGRFKLLSDNDLKTLIRADASPEAQSRLSRFEVTDVVERVQTEPSIQVQRDYFDKDEFLVNFLNGTFDIRSVTLLQHSPNFCLTSIIKAKYIPNYHLEGTLFESYLQEVCDGSDVKIDHLAEIIGYNLSGLKGVKKASVFNGPRHSSKTTLDSIVQGLLGSENVSHFSMKALNERFTLGKLLTRKVNIFGERGAGVLKDCETFKALTGCEWSEAENKNEGFVDRPANTKLIFAGNRLPEFEDPEDSQAYMDRITLFQFTHTIPEEKRIKDMDKRLLEEERDIIASWAMSGLSRLIDSNYTFHEAPDALAIRKSRISQASSTEEFINENIEFGSNHRVFSTDLYGRYRDYCHKNALDGLRQVEFIKEVIAKTECRDAIHKKVRIGKAGPYYGFVGLGLINEDENVLEDTSGTTEQEL